MIGRKNSSPNIDGAVQKAVNYEITVADLARRSERRAWMVASGAVVMSLILAGGYFYMLPLKEKVPYLIMADAYTGNATVARLRGDFSNNSITTSEAVNVDVDTNMVVRTERHSYIFELKVVATDWTALEQAKQAGAQYKITFRYPNDTEFAAEPAAKREVQMSTALEKDRVYNFQYDFKARTKQKWLVPVAVYDDGRFTYIRMNETRDIPTGNFPVVFGRERERSEDFVVNTTVEKNTIVVHGVYPYLVIRHGKNVVGLRRNKLQ